MAVCLDMLTPTESDVHWIALHDRYPWPHARLHRRVDCNRQRVWIQNRACWVRSFVMPGDPRDIDSFGLRSNLRRLWSRLGHVAREGVRTRKRQDTENDQNLVRHVANIADRKEGEQVNSVTTNLWIVQYIYGRQQPFMCLHVANNMKSRCLRGILIVQMGERVTP